MITVAVDSVEATLLHGHCQPPQSLQRDRSPLLLQNLEYPVEVIRWWVGQWLAFVDPAHPWDVQWIRRPCWRTQPGDLLRPQEVVIKDTLWMGTGVVLQDSALTHGLQCWQNGGCRMSSCSQHRSNSLDTVQGCFIVQAEAHTTCDTPQ